MKLEKKTKLLSEQPIIIFKYKLHFDIWNIVDYLDI